MSSHYVRYVAHHMVKLYEEMGWEVAGTGQGMGHHAHWSVAMKYTKPCEGSPPEPQYVGSARELWSYLADTKAKNYEPQ